MAKPKTPNNPKGAGRNKKPPTKVIAVRVKTSYVAPIKKVITEEIKRLDNLNFKKQK